MRAFLSIKYYDNSQNRELIENMRSTLKKINIDLFAFVIDYDFSNESEFNAEILMKRAFEEIDKSDVLIIDASELSIGIGIEAGYAYTKNIPIYLIANKKANVSNTIKGISTKQVYYENIDDLLKLAE